jgi:hypothetical protein
MKVSCSIIHTITLSPTIPMPSPSKSTSYPSTPHHLSPQITFYLAALELCSLAAPALLACYHRDARTEGTQEIFSGRPMGSKLKQKLKRKPYVSPLGYAAFTKRSD